MIPRIVHPRHKRIETAAFLRGAKARPLRIFVDGETVPDSPEVEILLRFAHHDEIEVIGTDSRFPNRLSVGAFDTEHDFTPWNIELADGGRTYGGVPGGDTPELGRRYKPSDQSDERAERAMVMAAGAEAHGSDALVTGDPLLLELAPRNWIDGANPMSAPDAVALLGLFLRVRQDFAVEIDEGWRLNFDRALFYWVLLRDLTPAGWRWFSALVAHSHHSSDDTLLLTGQSALERIERAFRARDRVHENLQLPESRDAATEAIFYFDIALFMLGGAFDGLARVAHVVHGIGRPDQRSVGWGSNSWMKNLRTVNPILGEMMRHGRPHRDARELVAVLRNTIHQEALRTITWQSGGKRSERVIVPASVEADLESTVARVGTPDAFGLSRGETDGRLYVDPGRYLEAILPHVFAAINAVMNATPVETLDGVDASELLMGAPDDETFSESRRQRIRLLGGVGWSPGSSTP